MKIWKRIQDLLFRQRPSYTQAGNAVTSLWTWSWERPLSHRQQVLTNLQSNPSLLEHFAGSVLGIRWSLPRQNFRCCCWRLGREWTLPFSFSLSLPLKPNLWETVYLGQKSRSDFRTEWQTWQHTVKAKEADFNVTVHPSPSTIKFPGHMTEDIKLNCPFNTGWYEDTRYQTWKQTSKT